MVYSVVHLFAHSLHKHETLSSQGARYSAKYQRYEVHGTTQVPDYLLQKP